MEEDWPIVLPYTLDSEEANVLLDALHSELPGVSIEYHATPSATKEALTDAPIVVAFGFPDELLSHAESLHWVQALSAGVNTYNVDELQQRDVKLTTVSGVHAQPAAEQAIGYMLAFERGFPVAFRNQNRGVWERYDVGELHDSTVGIIGLGSIGERVAELASAFGVETIGLKRDLSTGGDVVDELVGPDGLESLLVRSDHVVLACPLTDETRNMIDQTALKTMNNNGVLLNVARGGLVEHSALVQALQRDWIRGAALDVVASEPLDGDSPLWDLSNVILTPHMAGLTPRYMERCAAIVADNYRAFVAGDPLQNRVV